MLYMLYMLMPFMLVIGIYLLIKGKAFGSLFGAVFGISLSLNGIEQLSYRMNKGNAGERIVPTWENSQWYIWNTEIIWGIAIALLFVVAGIFVFARKKRKYKKEVEQSDNYA